MEMAVSNRKTPYYLIHKTQFEKNCMEVEKNFHEAWGGKFLCGYSIKTNHQREMVRLAKERGWLAEVVSDDEYNYAKSLGFGDHEMICNGPVKGKMMEKVLQEKQYLNLDHLQEVDRLCMLCQKSVCNLDDLKIGLRINFDLERLCPGETTAGKRVSRFGINYENGDLKKAILMLQRHKIPIAGLHMHTSTKSRSIAVFRALSQMACKVAEEYGLDLDFVDIGGGFFGGQRLPGKPTMSEYAHVITHELKKTFDAGKVTLIAEPGASVIATAIDYVTGVDNIRDVRGERIVTLDGTMLHINPFMAERKPVYTVENAGGEQVEVQHICGCTCMENDRFDTLYSEKELRLDSKIVFHHAGAYTMSFNSHFIIEPPEVYLL